MKQIGVMTQYKLKSSYKRLFKNLSEVSEFKSLSMFFKDLSIPQGKAITNLAEFEEESKVFEALEKAGFLEKKETSIPYEEK